MTTCPSCGHTWAQSRCGECGATVLESEAIVANGRKYCSGCAASAVRQKREAVRPAMPDPELQPAEWEAAWSAARRRQRS